MWRSCWLCLLLLIMAAPGFAQTEEYLAILSLPPGSRPVPVEALFYLSDITRIDDQEETFHVKGTLALNWKDTRQAFDPASAGVPEKIYQGPFQFLEIFTGWWPQVVVANGVDLSSIAGITLRIRPDGAVSLFQEISLTARSPMNLRRYPFDRQELHLIFESQAFLATEVKLTSGITDLPARHIRVPEWNLLNMNVETIVEQDDISANTYSMLIVSLDMERRPAYTIWAVAVPMSLIVLLSMSVFWMDRESLGSRMDVSFIGLLTIVAFQSLVSSDLPDISYFILMDGFVYVAYLGMASCVISNLWVDHLNRRGARLLADRFDWHARWAFPTGFIVLNVLSGLYFYFS